MRAIPRLRFLALILFILLIAAAAATPYGRYRVRLALRQVTSIYDRWTRISKRHDLLYDDQGRYQGHVGAAQLDTAGVGIAADPRAASWTGRRVVFLELGGIQFPEFTRGDLLPQLWSVLAEEGTVVTDCLNGGRTGESAGTHCLFTGVRANLHATAARPDVPTVFEYLRAAHDLPRSAAWHLFTCHQNAIGNNGGLHPEFGPRYWPARITNLRTDTQAIEQLLEILDRYQPVLLAASLKDADRLAQYGRDAEREYHEAIRWIDDLVLRVWRAIQSHESYRDRTTLILATNHGRSIDDHAPDRPKFDGCERCRRVGLLAVGGGVPRGQVIAQPVAARDIAPTIAALLDAPAPYAIGRPIRALLPDGTATAPRPPHPSTAPEEPSTVLSGSAPIARDPDLWAEGERLFIAWREPQPDPSRPSTRLVGRSSADGGTTWSEPTPLLSDDTWEEVDRPILLPAESGPPQVATWVLARSHPNMPDAWRWRMAIGTWGTAAPDQFVGDVSFFEGRPKLRRAGAEIDLYQLTEGKGAIRLRAGAEREWEITRIEGLRMDERRVVPQGIDRLPLDPARALWIVNERTPTSSFLRMGLHDADSLGIHLDSRRFTPEGRHYAHPQLFSVADQPPRLLCSEWLDGEGWRIVRSTFDETTGSFGPFEVFVARAWRPAVAARGGTLLVAWESASGLTARWSLDGGASWSPDSTISGGGRATAASIALADPLSAHFVWQSDTCGEWRVAWRRLELGSGAQGSAKK